MATPKTANVWTHEYQPRSYFMAFHYRTQRYALLVVHRQAGKTHAVINDMLGRAVRTKKPDWRGAYIAPFLGQARKAAWKKLLTAVRGYPDVKISKAELSVTLRNGAVITIYGADNAEALRGDTLDYACLDEFGDMHPTVLSQIVRPMLAARLGLLVIIGTPKGDNHFHTRHIKALGNPKKWFHQLTTIEDTKDEAISYAEQKEMREDMEDPEWNQEMLCSFTAEFRGSYYATQLETLRTRGGLASCPWNKDYPVHIAMDIGRADACAMWFWQYVDGFARIFKYFEATGLDAEEACDILQSSPYVFDTVWLPHDAAHRTFASRKSVLDTFNQRGLPAKKVLNPDGGHLVFHGIDATRKVLRLYPILIDPVECVDGLKALRNYSRKWDLKRQVYSNVPNHDKWSHGADGFRYLSLCLDITAIHNSKPIPAHKYTEPGAPMNLDTMLKRHDRRMADRAGNYYRVRN